ncbi:MAG: ABC transporter permease [Fretibacterium sp.]|uniref:ABC transporter permease n=1 Tax=Fretibacterium sp. OH1220_COT-178 TaxID=2491047 RepID=UPI000F5D8135|nr:ABC transporter permease [Fretibacterium sp. OH1220_COT-178]MDO4786145.1 ABC transporter permease [Fretibacterium sp.]RRD65230.1 ABC transporter permease [Fretibacterium sp. OH1220_COT-178]
MGNVQTASPGRVRESRQSRLGELWRRLRSNKGAVLGLVVILLLTLMAIFAPYLAPYDPNKMNSGPRLAPPSWKHPLGTDNFGRDQLSRIIYGARISLYVGFIAVGIGAFFGGFIGAVVGYYGGRIDNLLMRLMDVLLAVPQIILAIAIVGALGANLLNLMIAVGVSQIPRYARIVRASALSVRGQEFVEAARAIGASDLRIITENILPNCMAPIIVQSTLGVAAAILSAAALSFLGLGIQPPTAEWGSMLSLGRQYMRNAPHLTFFPGLVIAMVVLALNLFGDGLRDALDPRLRQ